MLIAILIILLVAAVSCIRVVPHTESYVIERLGKFHEVWEAGIHFLLPFGIDRVVARATTKEKVLEEESKLDVDALIAEALEGVERVSLG